MKKRLFCISLLLISVCNYGQKLPNIIPPSPDVYNFNKYGEIPVGYYTGVPNIKIPIHNLSTSSGYNLPITINYHASGIKVDEKASRVGLGWILNAGGVISSTIRGIRDGSGVWYSSSKRIPQHSSFDPNNYFSNYDDYKYAQQVVNGESDSEPDIYNFSYPGKTGKFIFDQKGKIHIIPNQPIKIEGQRGSFNFSIRDEKGNQYKYNTLNSTELHSSCPSKILSPFIDLNFQSSSKLSQIITNTGEIINFEYSNKNFTYTFSNEQTDYIKYPSSYGCPNKPLVFCEKNMTNYEAILKKIKYRNQEIRFIYSNDNAYPIKGSNTRKDFPGNPALRKIEIWNKSNLVKSFEFNYDYFFKQGEEVSNKDSYRLKLVSIQENTNKKTHYFYYNEDVNLPKRFSFNQDFWGYYNGRKNKTILPEIYFNNNLITGADKSVNEKYSQANVLTKIVYPTKGYTEFEYESNDYYNDKGSVYYEKKNKYFPVASSILSNNRHNFSIETNYKDIKLNIVNDCNNEPTTISNNMCFIKIYSANNSLIGRYSKKGIYDLNISKGNYSLEYELFGNCNCRAYLTWDEEKNTPPQNIKIGGLRIKSIKNYYEDNVEKTTYQYTLPNSLKSSGIKHDKPQYYTKTIFPNSNNNNECRYLSRSFSSVYPLGSANGSAVGYDFVTETKETNNNQKHKTVYSFTNYPDYYNSSTWSYPYLPPTSYSWKRGLLLSKVMYKNQDTIFIENNTYDYDNVFATNSSDYASHDKIAAGLRFSVVKTYSNTMQKKYDYAWSYYYISNSWTKLINNKKKTFNSNGQNPITTTTNYFYDNENHLQQTRIETTNSKGEVLKTKIYYPDDLESIKGTSTLNNEASFAIQKLKFQHRIAEPIQTDTYKGSVLLSRQRTNYKDWGNNIVLPKNVEMLKGNQGLEDRIIYHSYDAKGNPTEVSKKDGTRIVYIWGYHQTQPIAKIENATLSEVGNSTINNLQILSNLDKDVTSENTLRNALNSLRNNATYKNKWQVTSYTYDPLIGVTSITDPRGETVYYEYDDFNRLQYVKDAQGNVLKEHQYHYKQN